MINPVSINQAASAYSNAAGIVDNADKPAADMFAKMVTDSLTGAMGAVQHAEQMATAAVSGSNKVNLTDLVTAISGAELALSTIVTIRDRAISAYQDIVKMPI